MGCGCFSCGECVKFLSGSPGRSGSGSVDDFPDTSPSFDESYVLDLVRQHLHSLIQVDMRSYIRTAGEVVTT